MKMKVPQRDRKIGGHRYKLNLYLFIYLLVTTLFSFADAKKHRQFPPGEISVTAFAPSVPVLKRLAANPVLRVMVAIPAGNAEQKIRTLQCSLNAFSAIQKIDVYLTGAEPFSATNLVASVQPSSNRFNMPVMLDLQAGLHFIWLSIVLKNDAAINNKINLHCTKLVYENGHVTTVKEDTSTYAKYTGVAIRKAGDDGVNTYRIPGIVHTGKGTLIAVYDIRYNNSADLPGNIDIGMSRSTDSGKNWEPMKVILDMGGPNDNSGIGDPCILYDEVSKKIWVAALWSKGNHSIAGSIGGLSPDSTGQFVLTNSSDDGLTWSAPINVTPQVKDPSWKIFFQGPGSGIMMRDGTLVFPAQYWDEAKMPYSTIIYSDDQGKTWKGNIKGPKANTTESQVVETTPGTVMLNMRDNRGGFRSIATTNNMGTSWTEHASSYSALPDPVCMGSIIRATVNIHGRMKEVLFFSNPATTSGRYNISVKASLNKGETWLPANQALVDERASYGYSSLTKIDDNTIGLLYEGIKDLYFVSIPVKDIIK